MLRTYHHESWDKPIREEVARLERWREDSTQLMRQACWKEWYQRSFPLRLLENHKGMERKGITLKGIKKDICTGMDIVEDRKRLRANLQKVAATANLMHFLGVWEYRIDHKMERWRIQGNRHHVRNAVKANLERLGAIVPPRVAAAVWGLVWNRWCTARRFQGEAPCVLDCGKGEDSIEHYIGCQVGREAGRRLLRVDALYAQRKLFMLNATRFQDDAEQTCWAILTYALYIATNTHRGNPLTTSTLEEATEEVMHHTRQGVQGHAHASRVLRSRWIVRR